MNEIGITKDDMDTPALLADLDLIDKNILTMADYLKKRKTKLRAHTKVHRVPFLAHKQLKAGAKGICCQKVSEAEVMVATGIRDVMVTNEIVTTQKIMRLAALAKNASISVPIDNESNAQRLSTAAEEEGVELNVVLDVHLGSQRCGVEPGEPALKLAQSIRGLKGLTLMGLMGFEGHLSWIEPRDKRRAEIEKTESLLLTTKKLIENSGIHVEHISAGSTGTYDVSSSNPEITEVQAGTYLLMDAGYHKHVPEFNTALTVLSTVISRPSDERAITDAGLMSINRAFGEPQIVGRDDIEVHALHAENTILKTNRKNSISIGDKIELVPPYLDGTVNCHRKIYALRKGRVEAIWNTSRDTSS